MKYRVDQTRLRTALGVDNAVVIVRSTISSTSTIASTTATASATQTASTSQVSQDGARLSNGVIGGVISGITSGIGIVLVGSLWAFMSQVRRKAEMSEGVEPSEQYNQPAAP